MEIKDRLQTSKKTTISLQKYHATQVIMCVVNATLYTELTYK